MKGSRALAGAVAALVAATVGRAAAAEPGEGLPLSVEVKVVKVAEQELGAIERALKAIEGLDPKSVTNLTLPLQSWLEDQLSSGPVTIYPRATFDMCMKGLRAGIAKSTLAADLVNQQRGGGLARVARSSAPEKREAGPRKKIVPSVILDRERLSSPDPHLPLAFARQHRRETLKGTYLICVQPEGKVDSISVIAGLGEADGAVMEQVKSTWTYKPQPAPVCSPRLFVFEIE